MVALTTKQAPPPITPLDVGLGTPLYLYPEGQRSFICESSPSRSQVSVIAKISTDLSMICSQMDTAYPATDLALITN